MYHRVREAKYRTEIVTFVWDFREHINPGDTIVGVPSVEVLVSSGTDADPNHMILGLPVVTQGTIVSQKIRRGIPGTIYTITITVNTEQEDIFEDLAYLAILPLPNLHFTFFLETQLYPIELYYESLSTEVSLIGGYIFPSIIMEPEGITSEVTLADGTLFGGPLSYAMTILDNLGPNGHEALQSFVTLINGVLFGTVITYNMIQGEGLLSSITLIDGILFGSPINYTLTTEGLESFLTLIDGTLA